MLWLLLSTSYLAELDATEHPTPIQTLRKNTDRSAYDRVFGATSTNTFAGSASPTAGETAELGLACRKAPIPAGDPVEEREAVFLGCLLPREVTRVERMDLAVGEEVVKVLVVRPRYEVI